MINDFAIIKSPKPEAAAELFDLVQFHFGRCLITFSDILVNASPEGTALENQKLPLLHQ